MKKQIALACLGFTLFTGCSPVQPAGLMTTPALSYAKKVGGGKVPGFDTPGVGGYESSMQDGYTQNQMVPQARSAQYIDSRAQLRMVKDLPPEERGLQQGYQPDQMVPDLQQLPDLEVYRSQRPNSLDYTGPLGVGEPGVTSSLWRASKRRNDLFQDDRAWQPYDLVTIIIAENTLAQKEADTEVRTTTSVLAAIENFLGFEADATESNSNLDLANLINASTTTNYRGEGDTSRRGIMQASMSAMVVEVLPGGILRVEGEKIVSLNNEEEVLVISGLVRPRDVNSNNEVSSAKVAQLRVDFFGKGSVGSAQTGGWLSNIVRSFWPF